MMKLLQITFIFFFSLSAVVVAKQLSPALAPAENHESPAPSAQLPTCITLIFNDLLSCLPYLIGSNVPKPDAKCCAGFQMVWNFDPNCVCEAFKISGDYGYDINMTKAIQFPSACGFHDISIDICLIPKPPCPSPKVNHTPALSPGKDHPPAAGSAPPPAANSGQPPRSPPPVEVPAKPANASTPPTGSRDIPLPVKSSPAPAPAPGPNANAASTLSNSFLIIVSVVMLSIIS